MELQIRGALRVPAHRPAGGGSVGADLGGVMQEFFRAPAIHHQQDEIGGLAANLEAYVGAAHRDHRRRAPGAVAAAPANHRAAAIAGAKAEGDLFFRRNNRHANRLVHQVVRDALFGSSHDLGDDFRRILQPLRIFVGRQANTRSSPQPE